jgi:hypothetical protein
LVLEILFIYILENLPLFQVPPKANGIITPMPIVNGLYSGKAIEIFIMELQQMYLRERLDIVLAEAQKYR